MIGLARRWRWITLVSVGLLLITTVVWQLSEHFALANLVKALLLSVPLLAPLPGLSRGHRYTYRWATLCALPYFIIGITETIADPAARLWSGAMLGEAILWFAALIAYLRVTTDRDNRLP